jgi:hypothetical protein
MTQTLTLVQEAEERLAFAIKDLEDLSINGNHSINIKDVSRTIEESREILLHVLSTNIQPNPKQDETGI